MRHLRGRCRNRARMTMTTVPCAPCSLTLVSRLGGPLLLPQVAVVEAMKMRNILRADVEGVVASVEAAAGSVVGADQVVVRFE